MNVRSRAEEGVVKVEGLKVSAYQIPTDAPEADGTLGLTGKPLVLVTLDKLYVVQRKTPAGSVGGIKRN
jgi:hypothetical protein